MRAGICSVYSPHTTCSVRVNEWERSFFEDFAVMLCRLVPTEHYSAHDDRSTEDTAREDDQRIGIGNRPARCMSMLGPPRESIPVRDGELSPGTWQRVLFLELDAERDRHWLVQVDGV